MKSSISFVFAAMVFTGILSVVSANIWKIQLECKIAFYLVITHENELGFQKISYNSMTIKGKNEICSDDEVICLKDVNIAMDSCEKVTLDFKVQYANQWSKNQHIVVHSDLDDVGYLSPQYFFIPSFES